MSYRSPGIYAKFVKTASAVPNAGASRIMALVGTGISYYEVYNETIQRNSDRPYDELANNNVFEISSVSSRPIYSTKNNPENVIYTKMDDDGIGDFQIKDGKYIVWRTLSDDFVQPTLVNVDTDPYINEGSRAFEQQCKYFVDANNSHFMIDGEWRIEVTFANQSDGCYRIIKLDTNELIGEYVVGTAINTAIPGINLTVPSTYKLPDTSDIDSDDNLIKAGDYFIIKTVASKTEQEAAAAIDTQASVPKLRASISKVNLINTSRVKDASYRIVIKNATTHEFQVVEIESINGIATETVIYPDANDTTAYATWIEGDEIYDGIPGVEVILGALIYEPNVNDSVTITTQARVVDETIPGEGDSYYVSYKYRKDDEGFDAQYFSTFDEIRAEYGDYEVTASGFVKNSLTLGSEIAFANGVTQIICVQAKGNTDAEFCDAIDRLRKTLPGVDNVNTVVPLSTSATVGTYCMNHVDIMSSYDYAKERMCYLGASMNQPMSKQPTAADRSLGIIEACKGYSNERVVFVAPGRVIKSVKDINTGKYYDRPLAGCYLAVAVACLGLGSDPAEPFTNKSITGFSYLPDSYTKSELNLMATNGACLLVMRGNNIIVRHGITTDAVEVNSMEITCIQIKDYVIEAVRTTLGQLYIGLKNTSSVIGDIQFTVNNILSQFVGRTILESYAGLSVTRSKTDPRAINVKFEIMPIYAVTYIDIEFSFSTYSG